VLDSIFYPDYTVGSILLAMVVSLVCGALITVSYFIRNERATRSLLISFVLLPIITMAVVMLISSYGGIGVGLAIAGAFNLVRFRSIPGTAWDITIVFLAMAVGIATGLGQIYFAMMLAGIVCTTFIVLKLIPDNFLSDTSERDLRVTVSDDLDYSTEFQEIFSRHTQSVRLKRIKSIRMGSLYELRYQVRLKDVGSEKRLIDEIRTKNSNLPVSSACIEKQMGEEL